MFAEFLLFLLVFPFKHTSVGVTVIFWTVFWVMLTFVQYLLWFGPLIFGGGSVPIYMCAGRGALAPLITHFSMVAPMFAWGGLVGLGG